MEETSKGIISYNSEGVGVQQAENGEQESTLKLDTLDYACCVYCP